MKGIQIKINGQWIYLPEDFSISLEQTSPVFNEQGTFSFPFEIPLEPNRSVFKNIADPFGDISLRDIDKAPAEIWFGGVMLYRGIIEVDEEIELEESIPVTFLSGNSDFMSRIEGMNCRDVPLDREIKLGYVLTTANYTVEHSGETARFHIPLPEHIAMNYSQYNVSEPYPIKPFCNVRICTSNDLGTYNKLEAERPFSGICFFVRYLLDCIMLHLGVNIKKDDLGTVEDMNRLAFFSTQCHVSYMEERDATEQEIAQTIRNRTTHLDGVVYYKRFGEPIFMKERTIELNERGFTFKAKDVYATNKNFPDIEIQDLIEDLKTAFGICFVFDERSNSISMVYMKDILRQDSILNLDCDIRKAVVVKTKDKNWRLTYEVEDDTAYNYDDYTDVLECNGYEAVLNEGVSAFDKRCFVDTQTGNAYRIKVNKDTGGDPSLFEVGGFRDYNTLDNGDDEEENSQSVKFRPVMINDISKHFDSGDEDEQLLAVFTDVELLSDTQFNKKIFDGYTSDTTPNIAGGEFIMKYYYRAEINLEAICQENYDMEASNEAPLRSYDAGYTLGIMRGPGNESGLETIEDNYDGEGNSSWTQTVANYSFTADSCDNYGRFFDYNGTEEGGADQAGRFSLKLIAGKDGYPIGDQYADRGLVSKFLSEYLYFMANKKTVVLNVGISITQIIGIDFLKRYKIGDFVGFINKVSYTLDVNGIAEATIELYTL